MILREWLTPYAIHKIDPSSDPKLAPYTNNGKFPQKLLKNRFVPKIIPGAIRPIDQLVMEDEP